MNEEAPQANLEAGHESAGVKSADSDQVSGTTQTRYQRLSAMASAHAMAFIEHRAFCGAMAHDLLQAAYLYFEAPEGSIRLLTLGEDLTPAPLQGKFSMVLGRDAFWYFALAIKLDGNPSSASEVMVTLGLKRQDEEMVVRMRSDHRVRVADPRRWTRMLQNLDGALCEHYQRAPSEPRKPIGFSPS